MPPRAAAPAKTVRHLTDVDLVERYGGKVSVGQLANWRSKGIGPNYLRGESSGDKALILYPLAWVEEWEESRRVRTASA